MNNSNYGSVDLTVGGVNYSYNPHNLICNTSAVTIINGQLYAIGINIPSCCPDALTNGVFRA